MTLARYGMQRRKPTSYVLGPQMAAAANGAVEVSPAKSAPNDCQDLNLKPNLLTIDD